MHAAKARRTRRGAEAEAQLVDTSLRHAELAHSMDELRLQGWKQMSDRERELQTSWAIVRTELETERAKPPQSPDSRAARGPAEEGPEIGATSAEGARRRGARGGPSSMLNKRRPTTTGCRRSRRPSPRHWRPSTATRMRMMTSYWRRSSTSRSWRAPRGAGRTVREVAGEGQLVLRRGRAASTAAGDALDAARASPRRLRVGRRR